MNNLKQIFTKLWSPRALFSKDITLLFFRVSISLAMIKVHGLKKLNNWAETVAHIPDPFGMGGELSAVIAIFANVIGPLMVIIGLCTRIAILPILSLTLVGFFIVHGADPWPVRDVPLMYSIAFSLLLVFGPGKYALDSIIYKKINS